MPEIFIVWQNIITIEKQPGRDNIIVNSIVRKVEAQSEAEALGKFIIGTEDEFRECEKRLAPGVAPLNRLKEIK